MIVLLKATGVLNNWSLSKIDFLTCARLLIHENFSIKYLKIIVVISTTLSIFVEQLNQSKINECQMGLSINLKLKFSPDENNLFKQIAGIQQKTRRCS